MPVIEISAAGLIAGCLLTTILVARRPHRRAADMAVPGVEFEILPPPDHDRPTGAMLADLARSGGLDPVPPLRLLGGDRTAAFGRAVRISARAISYRDFAGDAWAPTHAARLENIYPGIRVIPCKEGNC